MKPTVDDVKNLARGAGEILRSNFDAPQEVHHKGIIDIVTEMDKRSEAYLIKEIRSRFPTHRIVAEEAGALAGADGECWYIDPLDGTVNYAHGVPIYCVSVGFVRHGEPVLGAIYDPMQNELFIAEQGAGAWLGEKRLHVSETHDLIQSLLVTGFPYDLIDTPQNNLQYFEYFTLRSQGVRRLGSAALDLAYVAAGRLDGFWEIRLNPWDVAAGGLMVREAGGILTNLCGKADFLQPPVSILAANPQIHPQMLAVFKANCAVQ